jgi:hypothetical protein
LEKVVGEGSKYIFVRLKVKITQIIPGVGKRVEWELLEKVLFLGKFKFRAGNTQ